MKFIDFINSICNILTSTEKEDLELFKSFLESEIIAIYYLKEGCFLFKFKTGQILIKANLEAGGIQIESSSFEKADSDRKDLNLIEFVSLVCSLLAKIQKEDLAFFNKLSESEIRWTAYSGERNGFIFSFAKGDMVVVVDAESLSVVWQDKDNESEDVIQ